MLRTRTTLLAATIAIAGCRLTKVPSSILQPVVTTSTNDTSIKSGGLWILTPSHQPQAYHSISQTTVHEVSDPVIRQNSIEVTTAFTISLDQSQTPLIISGHIDTVRFSPQNQSGPNNNSLTLPLLFEGELTHDVLTITVKNPQLLDGFCSPFVSSILSDLHTVVAIYPTHLTPAFTWRDSTLVTTCTTGGVPTTRKTIQSFRVVGERAFNTMRALLLERLDSTYITGDGAEGNHQIHLEGIGTATANIYISPTVAVTLGVELSEKTEITIITSGRTRHFIQEVTQRLKATN
jgi:hypothetical protein